MRRRGWQKPYVRRSGTPPRVLSRKLRDQAINWTPFDAALGIRAGAEIEFDLDDVRPKTRGECVDGIRPCPWAGCRHHMYLEVQPRTGTIKLNYPDLELEQLAETCSLDVAARGERTLDQVGKLLNITRERARQLEEKALSAADVAPAIAELRPT